jgi:CBS domain-containing protein
MTVAAILKQKGSEVAHVAPTATIAEVVQGLVARRIGAVLVQDSAGQVLGIVSERDVVRSMAEHGGRTMEMTAAQLMTTDLHVAGPGTTVVQATEMMTTGRFRHLPVMDGDHLLGIVSIGDVVKARLSQQEQEVDSLKAYVAGS